MASDTQKLRLEFALVNNPDFKKVADEDHWIYIPRELQEAVASASQEMEPGTIKPDVCKLAEITSVWMTSKAIDLPRRTIKDWMEKGWGKIDLTDEDSNDIPLAPKYV